MIIDNNKNLVRLAWDSEHFGFEVAQLDGNCLSQNELYLELSRAKGIGFSLVCCITKSEIDLSDNKLKYFSGQLVDKKVTYCVSVGNFFKFKSPCKLPVKEYPKGLPTEDIISLGVAAGQYSRFRVDEQFPENKFRELYTTWVKRDTLHETADIVYLIHDSNGEVVGMITLIKSNKGGHIRLCSVDEKYRERGVGKLLIKTAHTWMKNSCCNYSIVVTQIANISACKLYEKCGYHAIEKVNIYHFWVCNPISQKNGIYK